MDRIKYTVALARSAVLQQLAHDVGLAVRAPGDIDVEALTGVLAAAATREPWLPPEQRRANHERYARHLIHADPRGRFSILAVVWAPGQASPVHGHRTWGATAVYQGELKESFYHVPTPAAGPVEHRQAMRPRGSVHFDDGRSDIHRLTNHGSADAVTLHVYGVPGDLVSIGVNRIYRHD